MSKLVVAQFLSLDGVMEAPEKWSFPYSNDEIMKYKTGVICQRRAFIGTLDLRHICSFVAYPNGRVC